MSVVGEFDKTAGAGEVAIDDGVWDLLAAIPDAAPYAVACDHEWAFVPPARFKRRGFHLPARSAAYAVDGVRICHKCGAWAAAAAEDRDRFARGEIRDVLDYWRDDNRPGGGTTPAVATAACGTREERHARERAELEATYVGKRFGVKVVEGVVRVASGGGRNELRCRCVRCGRVTRHVPCQLVRGVGASCTCVGSGRRRLDEQDDLETITADVAGACR